MNGRSRREVEPVSNCTNPLEHLKGTYKARGQFGMRMRVERRSAIGAELKVNPIALRKVVITTLLIRVLCHPLLCLEQVNFELGQQLIPVA